MKRASLVLLATLAGVVALWLSSVGLVLLAGARSNARTADVILVLGAAQWNGRPSPVLKARLDHALALWRRGLAPRIIFTGGVGAGDTISEGEVARQYALSEGVPDSVILVERRGSTSAESIRAAARLMEERGFETAVLVSDSYHMLRLELLARRAGIRPTRSPAPDAPIDRAREERRHYVLRESLLFPVYAIVGGR